MLVVVMNYRFGSLLHKVAMAELRFGVRLVQCGFETTYWFIIEELKIGWSAAVCDGLQRSVMVCSGL